MVDEVVMAILDCLEIDNQLSVRYTMEWLVVMLISQFPFSWKELLLPHLQMVLYSAIILVIVLKYTVIVYFHSSEYW